MLSFIPMLLLITAAQIFGSLLSYPFVAKFCKNLRTIVTIESVLMLIAAVILIVEGIRITYFIIVSVLAGIAIFALLNKIIPHKHKTEAERVGFLVFIAMCFHELPEGIAFGASYLVNPILGVVTAITIALHNIPEGSIVTLPYFIEKRFFRGFMAALVTQILFVAGGFLAFYALLNVSPTVQALCMTFAAGAMLYIIYEEHLLMKKCNK